MIAYLAWLQIAHHILHIKLDDLSKPLPLGGDFLGLFLALLLSDFFQTFFFFQHCFFWNFEYSAHGIIKSLTRSLARHFGRRFCFHMAIIAHLPWRFKFLRLGKSHAGKFNNRTTSVCEPINFFPTFWTPRMTLR